MFPRVLCSFSLVLHASPGSQYFPWLFRYPVVLQVSLFLQVSAGSTGFLRFYWLYLVLQVSPGFSCLPRFYWFYLVQNFSFGSPNFFWFSRFNLVLQVSPGLMVLPGIPGFLRFSRFPRFSWFYLVLFSKFPLGSWFHPFSRFSLVLQVSPGLSGFPCCSTRFNLVILVLQVSMVIWVPMFLKGFPWFSKLPWFSRVSPGSLVFSRLSSEYSVDCSFYLWWLKENLIRVAYRVYHKELVQMDTEGEELPVNWNDKKCWNFDNEGMNRPNSGKKRMMVKEKW